MKRTLLAAGVVLAALSAPVSAQVVNLNAQTATTAVPVTLVLGAGDYSIFDVGPGDMTGAAYTAWNPWGSGSGSCDTRGANCSYGWYRHWVFDYGSGAVGSGNSGFFSTAAGALAAAQANDPLNFSLAATTIVKFWIADYPYWDNSGGVSLNIAAAPIPEPETWALMIAGLGLMGAVARRRQSA